MVGRIKRIDIISDEFGKFWNNKPEKCPWDQLNGIK